MRPLARRSENSVMQTKEPFWTDTAQIAQTIWEKIQQRQDMDEETQTLLQQIEINQGKR